MMKRRTFIKQSTGVVSGLALLPILPGCDESARQDYPIIDTHQHLWDSRFKLSWPKDPIDKGDFMLPQYRTAVEGLNFVKSIYMEVGAAQEYSREEALFALDLAEDASNNTVGACIRADPSDDNFRAFISEFAKNPYLKGVRGRLKDLDVFNSSRVTDNLRWLGEQGLSFDLIIQVNWLTKVIPQFEKCPETTIIVNHCGSVDPVALLPADIQKPREPKHNSEVWQNGMKALAENENIICKISGIVNKMRGEDIDAALLGPCVNYCLDSFGPDRVVFASDWPVCLYGTSIKEWVRVLKEIVKDRPMKEQRKLFHDNAKRIYEV